RDHAQQRPGVDEAPLVGMVLDGHVVQAQPLDLPRGGQQRIGGGGDEEVPELQLAAVVGHRRRRLLGLARPVMPGSRLVAGAYAPAACPRLARADSATMPAMTIAARTASWVSGETVSPATAARRAAPAHV